jgi:prephenate dehydrogenase
MTNKKFKIAIIGFGRFGRLMSQILSPFGEIFVISRSKISENNIKQIDYADLKKIDLVIPSVPISTLPETLKKIGPNLKPKSIVMDVCSVKVKPCQWLKKYIPKDNDIIGTHPMFGPDSAKNGLAGLQIVICPLRISRKKLERLKNIFKKLKLSIIEITPEDHDRQVAISLALVHFIGRGLGEINFKNQKITTLGFQRLQAVNETVNNDTWELFFDMQNLNPYTKKIRHAYIQSLTKLNQEIERKQRRNS